MSRMFCNQQGRRHGQRLIETSCTDPYARSCEDGRHLLLPDYFVWSNTENYQLVTSLFLCDKTMFTNKIQVVTTVICDYIYFLIYNCKKTQRILTMGRLHVSSVTIYVANRMSILLYGFLKIANGSRSKLDSVDQKSVAELITDSTNKRHCWINTEPNYATMYKGEM